MDTPGKWHFEVVTNNLMVLYRINDIVHTGKTRYQNVDILDSDAFGRCLVLDGKTQSTEIDEHIYHEALVHPLLLYHPEPRSVFIGGGGEGATLREVLRHCSVERVVMLDLDSEVVELCRLHLPDHHQGGFDDPRLELRHEDARQYLQTCDESFDAIVLDLVDPLEGGPSYLLYTREFYEIAKAKLRPGGVLVTQSGSAGLLNYDECFTAIAHTMPTVFSQVSCHTVYIPAFTTLWGFVVAVNEGGLDQAALDKMAPELIDQLIGQRLSAQPRHYDGAAHQAMFSLPRYLRQAIEAEQRIVTDADPVFMV